MTKRNNSSLLTVLSVAAFILSAQVAEAGSKTYTKTIDGVEFSCTKTAKVDAKTGAIRIHTRCVSK